MTILKAEKALDYSVHNPDFLVVSGSRLYGCYREDSDWDYRGFVIPPFEYILQHKNFESKNMPVGDCQIFSLRHIVDLVLKGEPQFTEILFASDDHIHNLSYYGRKVLDMRSHMVSQKIYHRLMGFSNSEWRKARGEKLYVGKRNKTEDDVIRDIRNTFDLDRENTDKVIDILLQNKPCYTVKNRKDIGEKRKAEFEQFGYCVSSACHSIRLLDQLYELMTTREIAFPRPNAGFLKEIKEGKVTWDVVENAYYEKVDQIENEKNNSVLPEKPNYKLVWDEVLKLYVIFLNNDERFQKFRSTVDL